MTVQKYMEWILKAVMVVTVIAAFVMIDQANKSPEANAEIARIAAGKR